METIDDIIERVPVSAIAARLGVDEATARAAVEQAVPALAAGMQANSRSESGAQSLAKALDRHRGGDPAGPTDPAADLDSVDGGGADGEKIVQHVFGGQRSDVVQRLGSAPGPADSPLIAKLLPLLAPIVMRQIAKQLGGGSKQRPAGGGGLADALGSMVAGSGSGKGVQDLLGDLLGGGRR